METVFKLPARLAVMLAVCANGVLAQAPTQAPSKPAGGCAELTGGKARLGMAEKRLNDWPNLARYRDENPKVLDPAQNEERGGFMGHSNKERWVHPRVGGFFLGEP